MPKIAFLGAGSLGFGPKLVADMLTYDSLVDSEIHLVDPNEARLELVAALARRMVLDHGLPTRIAATTDREAGLEGADYVIASIRVRTDLEALDVQIPLEVGGLRQTVADTVGIGGILKGLRTIPAMLAIARDMERLCPDALLLNYTNPMAMIQWAMAEATSIATVGLCHSVQGTSQQLASYLGVPYERLAYRVYGINHLAWFTQLRLDGEDLYPRLRACLDEPAIVAKDPVRFEILRHFGYFVTESSTHMAEYVPWFLGHSEEIERLAIRWRDADSLARWTAARVDHEQRLRERATQPYELHRSHEYAATILNAVETDTPAVIHGNVLNSGLIPNLPDGCCVEVPVLCDRAGLRPCYSGPLPPQCAALCAANIAPQGLTVRAVLDHDREAAIRAAMVDPNTAAQLTLPAIRESMDRLLDSQRDVLPEWR